MRARFFSSLVALVAALTGLVAMPSPASASTLTFTNKTTANGLGSNLVKSVFVDGQTIYLGHFSTNVGGLSTSRDGGVNFTHSAVGTAGNGVNSISRTASAIYAGTGRGLYESPVSATSWTQNQYFQTLPVASVFVTGSAIYVGWNSNLSTSTDSAATWTNLSQSTLSFNSVHAEGSAVHAGSSDMSNGGFYSSLNGGALTRRTTADGLGNNFVYSVYAVGSNVYAGTEGGLSISTDGGNTFTNRTTANGLGSNRINSVYAVGSTIYAGTSGGLSISTDGGNTFTNCTRAHGLGSNGVNAVQVVGSTIYAATDGGLSISSGSGTCTSGSGDGNNSSSRSTSGPSLFRVSLDANGGTCVVDGTSVTTATSVPFLGYRYIPGADECAKPGHTFAGWANKTDPSTVVKIPLLIDLRDNTWRYFIADNHDLIAVWTTS